ncbi:DNA-directed RNA polymerase III subunit RPC7-like [Nilaparvata lugens]|uniref:DNA-directed RNA polymerase III subunit RPC7-like n=1 Tax=Nilaparvata lugens TaxID=108931 RepID=UPI000B9975FA|nr:DNA-directed RNA polymerase III subunit RPC7-like [Nilaparvata lugens]
MAGRGRGMSFSVDQLGLLPGEMLPGPVLQPPPLFPPLEFAAAAPSAKPAHLAFRAALITHLRATGVFVAADAQPQGIVAAGHPQHTPAEAPLTLDWTLFPAELCPAAKGVKRPAPAPSTSKRPVKHVTLLLDELEKKEVKEEDDDEGKGAESSAKPKEGEGEEGGNEGERGDEEEDGGEWEDADEEMDDGTDYNQNYFDNGEGYLDDSDDNLDDGPIY